jgi:putative transposase
MRHYKILPVPVIQAASLSKDALRRLSWIDWYFSHGENAELTCRHFGIAKSVFYRWKNRYNPKNLQGLEFDTKTRRPHHVREMTTPQWIQQKIYQLRKEDPEKSKYEIQAELKGEGVVIGRKCIEKIIKRHPELWNTQQKKRVRSHRVRKIARVRAARELREKDVGSLVQMDTKYLSVMGTKLYLFSAIDCKSRYAFVYAYTSISSRAAKDFLTRVRTYFPFTIQAINTDNGSEYLLHFHQELEALCIPHFFTDPYCPKQNGRVERFHQTVEYEYLNYQPLLDDITSLREQCMEFNRKYNTKRFHQALGYKTPHQAVLKYLKEKGVKPSSI